MIRFSLPLIAVFLVACSGGRTLPDRGIHAYNLDNPAGNSAAGAAVSHAPGPMAGETTYTVQAGDSLYRIARDHGVSLAWLIERNNIVSRPVPAGTALVVPQR
ncbi:MAG: LysM peptidoglycan-binding domain-containing protein [Planctomycetota bacterium]|jgi:LysM repeat protein